ncbi:MAG: adenosylmethionine-8-amino-7-oxononanoate aminotransferase [Rhodocyclaceae bacterium]|nr:MAG: adenosylmethionine-8-amino-7-oxononanoate aminotransferase [Rhodocyclaceae bacterium]TND00477.1 MAG: adenosylmethionine-8-amino-7-oxononanoate aminotransferase [Rhodocyclaceae bacterium]
MSEARDWLTEGLPHIWLPYTQMATATPPLAVVATQGARIRLGDGRELIDGISSWWTACHGYNHPHIRAAVEQQLATLPHVMFAGLVHEPALRLAQRLAALLPGDLERVFFTESGSVAVEVALKMAIQYWRNKGQEEKKRIVYFRHAYHGDTFATMALCDPEEGMHTLFAGTMPDQLMAELPTDESLRRAFDLLLETHAERLAAVIVEPLVQGAGGMKMHDAQTLAFIAEACTRHKVLLIADEIMTGFGRTGRMFACEEATQLTNTVPDIVCLSKALTGGTLPLAATVARRHVFEAFLSDDPSAALMHGPTYMANALACAAANASLDLFEPVHNSPRLAQVAAIEVRLSAELAPCRELAGIAAVRVKGAIGAVELSGDIDLKHLRLRFAELGVWVRPFGNVVYLMPPFIIAADELATLTAAVRKVLDERAAQL